MGFSVPPQFEHAGMRKPPEVHNVVTGCETCDFTGYRGRVGIYEILRMNDALRQSVRSGNQNDEMRVLARQNGMKFMQEYALDLVRDGLTTFEEVQRVVALSQTAAEACGSCRRELSPNFAFCPFCGVKRNSLDLPMPVEKAPNKRRRSANEKKRQSAA